MNKFKLKRVDLKLDPIHTPMKTLLAALVITCVISTSCTQSEAEKTKIVWDTWGVPHVYANNVEDLFYAQGWAQMNNHANLILDLYGSSRGKGAEYWARGRACVKDSNQRIAYYLLRQKPPRRPPRALRGKVYRMGEVGCYTEKHGGFTERRGGNFCAFLCVTP